MTKATIDLAVADFARRVREALNDLPADEVDDLTDGLESGLSERLDDESTRETDVAELGDPVAYANELRAAAGLPPRAGSRPAAGSRVALAVARLRERVVARARRHPQLVALERFFVSLRPVWWAFRGWVGYQLVQAVFGYSNELIPSSVVSALVLLATLVVSVQFGRGKWLPFAWMRGLLVVANVLTLVAIPFAVTLVWHVTDYGNASAAEPQSAPVGLQLNGNQVRNIFPYDASGNPLTDVQLFDDNGDPLSAADSSDDYNYSVTDVDGVVRILVPSDDVLGRPGWNVFPLQSVDQSALESEEHASDTAPRTPATPPAATVPALVGAPAPQN